MPTYQYRNDSDTTYILPDIGEIHPDQRISVTTQFIPRIVLENYPDLVDVIAEEEAGTGRNYEKNPEKPPVSTLVDENGVTNEAGLETTLNPPEEPQDG